MQIRTTGRAASKPLPSNPMASEEVPEINIVGNTLDTEYYEDPAADEETAEDEETA